MQNINKEGLYILRLKFMAQALEEQYLSPSIQQLSFDERMNLLITRETQGRENNKQARRFKQAKLKINTCMEDISYRETRGLDRHVLANLSTGQFILNNQNVIITGLTGTGKTHISCALGNAAVRNDFTVFSIRLARLFEELRIAQADGSLPKYRTKLSKYNLLIIDDWGLAPVTTAARHELLELIDERVNKGSLIITSQLPVAQWHEYLGEPTIADAILDRVVQRAHRIELKGESMRKTDHSLTDTKEVQP